MGKLSRINVIFFVSCLSIGMALSMQAKQHLESYTPVTLKSIQVSKNDIAALNGEIGEMKELVEKKKKELSLVKSVDKGNKSIEELLTEEVSDAKAQSGYTDMEGPGIVIKMRDNQDKEIVGYSVDYDIIHDVDILNIFNDLRSAGAEAISINGQRIMSTSEIKCGGPIIRVNGKSVGTPFVIKAIGDPKLLYAAINAPNSYAYNLKNVFKIEVESRIEDSVEIPAYSKDVDYKFAKPEKEGE